MIGIVKNCNRQQGLVIFEDAFGDYGYFEVLGNGNFEVNEVISGNLHSLGGEIIEKQLSREKVYVFIEDFGMTLQVATKKVFG